MMMRRSGTGLPNCRAGLTRRLVVAGALAPLLVRCSSDPNSDTAGLTHLLGQSFDVFSGGSGVTLKEVSETQFASLGVRVGSGVQTMLVLASHSGRSTVWTSASHIALEIQSGRILRTAGLTQNLSGTNFSGADPLDAGLQTLPAPAPAKRSLDFSDLNAYGIAVNSTVEPAGLAEVDILGTRIACVHALERGTCPTFSWNFTNEYWASTHNGVVWRSLQFIHPDFDPLEIELLRPPKA
ncbi:MAG TPA: YjbF family lipoprotein [Rhizomicrobium sp.]|jgi:hypothetical protein|nr:YjbF family lipoprotein [Rhizomicrobium sp.]